MAVIVTTGDLKHKVVFKQPTSSLNDESGEEVSYTEALTTFAKVDRFNQYRGTEANVTALIGALDFTIRWSADREEITKDWLIEYKGADYVIHQIEQLEQKQRFIRFTAKSKGTLTVSTNSTSGEVEGGEEPTPDPEDVDLSNLELTFEVETSLTIVFASIKTDALQDSRIVWGDGSPDVVIPAADPISENHTYGPGTHILKFYPVDGLTNPAAQAVNKLMEVAVLKAAGSGVMTIGPSLSFAGFLREVEVDDLGMTTFPNLPNTGDDQVRRVTVKDNNLTGPELSQILTQLDAINWPTGYVDISGNPGTGSLTSAGETALDNLIDKGWTVNV